MSIQYPNKENYTIEDLLRIVEHLRSDEGCPWDREQTHQSIRQDLLEETYEAAEAIDLQDTELLKEELGDVLLQVVFHSRMEEEEGRFDFAQVCDGICRKLLLRHPHVFSTVQADTTEQVLVNWEKIKQKSKGQSTQTEAVKSVPKTFPALMRAQKVQKRAGKAGLDVPDALWALEEAERALDQLHKSILDGRKEQGEQELGAALLALTQVARKMDLNAEEALSKATERFICRFEQVEQLATQQGICMDPQNCHTLRTLWEQVNQTGGEPDSKQ